MRIEKTTKELYRTLFECFADTFWDGIEQSVWFFETATALRDGNMEGIRKAFRGGLTAMLMGGDMSCLDNAEKTGEEIEIKVTHKGRGRQDGGVVIGILVKDEIDW